MKKLKWYIVSKEYVKYLKKFDDKVEDIDYKKNVKPYIGIVLNIDKFNYYVPISSPKQKHYKMKENIDFIKIRDKRGIILGVLNLNNMIPVLNSEIYALKYNEIEKSRNFKNQDEKEQYIRLLDIELKIINSRLEQISNSAKKLYNLNLNSTNSRLAKRC